MKFTEGYWVVSDRAHAIYASCAYTVEAIDGGMRIVAPTKRIKGRGDTLNLPTITLEFRAVGHNVIEVRSYHYQAYDNQEPRFETDIQLQEDVTVDIREDQTLMKTGDITLRVDRNNFSYQFEADGKVITRCGFRNLGYMNYDAPVTSVLPGNDYLREDGQPYMMTELSLQVGENVYGLGERFTSFVKNGQVVDMWNEDGGTASQVAYKNIPFYMTNKGYGIFVDHSDQVSFEVASEKVEFVGFSVPGEELRYDFIYGPSPREIMIAYTSLTKKPALPPAWSFGLWLSTSFTTNYDEKTTSSFIEGMQERGIPFSVFHFDCFWMKEFSWCNFEWDERVFPDVEGMLTRYKDKGLKIDVWINPYIAQGTKAFKEGLEGGYFLKRSDGKGVKQVDWWQTGMALVDFTNPEACEWYQEKLRQLLNQGVDCFKTDFGERIPVDVTYYDGSNPKAMHNYYTYLYNKCVFELLEEVKGKNEAVLFARSATAGCQQFPVHWGGDCSASYPSMAETLRGGLSFALSGFAFWSHDISGFEQTASPDLYKRWVAFGMLSTHSRLHGSTSYRVPWLFDEESNDVVRFFVNLKCRLMPYIYAKAIEASSWGIPVMRPMVFEFMEDPGVAYLDMQYMLGESLLVAPVFKEDKTADYYLPKGRWTNYLSGETVEGGGWFKGTYDYFSLPIYVRENSLLAVGDVEDRPDYDYAKESILHLYSLADQKTATCQIPAVDGNIMSTIEIKRIGSQCQVSIEGQVKEIRLMLHDMPRIVSIDYGEMIEAGNLQIVKIPSASTCRIDLEMV